MSETPTDQLGVEQLLRRLAEAQSERDAAQHKVEDLQGKLQVEKLVNRQRHLQLQELSRKLAAATNRAEQQVFKWQLDRVQKRLDEANRERFGSKSERLGRLGDNDEGTPGESAPADCDSDDSGARESDETSSDATSRSESRIPAKPRQSGHGPTPQPSLVREEQLHLLPTGTDCMQCGGTLKAWKGRTQDSEEVDVIERTYRIKVHKYQTYKCCGCGHLETALAQQRMVPGGRYSSRFAISVAVEKYRDALPLARQVKRMAALGLKVTTQTGQSHLHGADGIGGPDHSEPRVGGAWDWSTCRRYSRPLTTSPTRGWRAPASTRSATSWS
jgi:transposase